jgi:hypothetical protein
MRTERTTTEIFLDVSEDVSKLTAEDNEKIALIQTLAEKRFDFDLIDAVFERRTADRSAACTYETSGQNRKAAGRFFCSGVSPFLRSSQPIFWLGSGRREWQGREFR